jgi:hypothetical protein
MDFSRAVVETALAHVVENKVEAACFRSDLFEKRRELMDAWAAFATMKPADVIAASVGRRQTSMSGSEARSERR